MLVFDCNVCHTKLSAQPAQVGAMVRCPQCHSTLRVPAASATSATPRPAAGGSPDAARFRSSSAATTTATTATAPQRAPASTTAAVSRSPASRQMIPASAAAAFGGSTGGSSAKRYGFNCGYCSSRLEATDSMAAQEGQCPTCGNTITIPIQDRYGRLIDPKTRQIIKQDPHPVHAYAAAGERAPLIQRQVDGKQLIQCVRCQAMNPITSNNCKSCGMPFTMEGTTLEAAGTSNGFSVASLVLGIIGLPASCTIVVPLLAVVFGGLGYAQASRVGAEGKGRGMAIAGMALGTVGCLVAVWLFFVR
jgi:ribosomal protein L40E